MPFFLRHRKNDLHELMDDPNCDSEKLKNTYRQFRTINKFLSRWDLIYKKEIKPILEQQDGKASLLDIGFGGGDISLHLSKLAANDGFHLNITSIDSDPRSLEYIQTLEIPSNIHFRHALSTTLVNEQASYDFVISNHLLHHLDQTSFETICAEAKLLATKKVIFNDIERSDLGYIFFTVLSKLFFRNSFISYDGRISIKRSYTFDELSQIAPDNWEVRRIIPYRLNLIYEKE
jgi:2-polyprenyl-3-methyl-5-hydroxy-6-metoxy-1,4-benzoquinol methylase